MGASSSPLDTVSKSTGLTLAMPARTTEAVRLPTQMPLTTKLAVAAVLNTVLCTAMTLAVAFATMHGATRRAEHDRLSSNLRVAWQLLQDDGGSIDVIDGKLRSGRTVLDGDTELVDQVQKLVGSAVTIFRGDMTVATNVRMANGARATGTRLAPGPAHDAVFEHHLRYIGQVDILGQQYLTIYDPMFSPRGELIGILNVAERITSVDAPWRTTRDWILFGGAAAALLAGIGSGLLATRMFRPLRGLIAAMLRLAENDVTIDVPGLERADDIGGMARAVQTFKESCVQVASQGAALRRGSERFEAALSNMSQGLCQYDAANCLEVVNRQFCTLYGIDPEKIHPGMPFREVLKLSSNVFGVPDIDFEMFVAKRQALIEKGVKTSMVVTIAGGRLVSILHCPMPGGGWVSTFEDVTDRHEANAKIVHMARHDGLTGLANRVVLNERIDQALMETGRGQHSALLCLDLDRFKQINDTLGHPVGDGLLRAVSDRLLACVREVDTVARLGGDEFAIIQFGIARPENAKMLAERIITTLEAPFHISGHDMTIGVSIGVALMGVDGATAGALLAHADMAMYRVKTEARGKFHFFEPGMDERLQRRRQIEGELRQALAKGEFELHYQPLVDLQAQEVSGFEALLRWHHPSRGMVSPAEFIPIAEEIGLIVPIGAWVINQACADAATWPTTISVAVNLSPLQFRSQNLVSTVASALRQSGLAAGRLELEVTETLLLQDNESTVAMLHQLRHLGTRISMDDFGTGYSSLSYLRTFPFDKLKIDQSFIHDLTHRADSIHIIRAIVGLCNALGMKTTAEGVETEEQREKLFSEGCTELQGYLFSKPRPASEIPMILERVRQEYFAAGARRAPVMPALAGS